MVLWISYPCPFDRHLIYIDTDLKTSHTVVAGPFSLPIGADSRQLLTTILHCTPRTGVQPPLNLPAFLSPSHGVYVFICITGCCLTNSLRTPEASGLEGLQHSCQEETTSKELSGRLGVIYRKRLMAFLLFLSLPPIFPPLSLHSFPLTPSSSVISSISIHPRTHLVLKLKWEFIFF